jgi:hypothetical protein
MHDNRVLNRWAASWLVALCLAPGLVLAQTRAEQEKQREQWQRVSDIFQAMGAPRGSCR